MKREHDTGKGFTIHAQGSYARNNEIRHVVALHKSPDGYGVTWDSKRSYDYWESHRDPVRRPSGYMAMDQFINWAQTEIRH